MDLVGLDLPALELQITSCAGIMDELAQEHGFSYTTVAPNIDEKAIRYEDPVHLVLALAHAKALAIGAQWEKDDALPSRGEPTSTERC